MFAICLLNHYVFWYTVPQVFKICYLFNNITVYHNFDPLYVVPTHCHWFCFCAGYGHFVFVLDMAILFLCWIWSFCFCVGYGNFVFVLDMAILFLHWIWPFCFCAGYGHFVFVLRMVILYFLATRFRWYVIVCNSSSDVSFTSSKFSPKIHPKVLCRWKYVYILTVWQFTSSVRNCESLAAKSMYMSRLSNV